MNNEFMNFNGCMNEFMVYGVIGNEMKYQLFV